MKLSPEGRDKSVGSERGCNLCVSDSANLRGDPGFTEVLGGEKQRFDALRSRYARCVNYCRRSSIAKGNLQAATGCLNSSWRWAGMRSMRSRHSRLRRRRSALRHVVMRAVMARRMSQSMTLRGWVSTRSRKLWP